MFHLKKLTPIRNVIMSYLNNYKPASANIPRDCHQHTPKEEYDHNYVFEVKALRSDRVELLPFIVSAQARPKLEEPLGE